MEILFAIQFKRSVLETLDSASDFICVDSIASFPVPLPAFRRLPYGKAGRAWCISSREHDVIDKFSEQGRYVLCVIQLPTLSTLGE